MPRPRTPSSWISSDEPAGALTVFARTRSIVSGGLAVVSRSSEETRILGASLAPLLLPGDVLSLNGDLGAGKTCFVQGMASALGVAQRVTSPTFTLVHEYSGRFPVVHLDVYRLNYFQEVLDLGFEELLDPGAILVVEWGEAVGPLLPARFLEIELRRVEAEENQRSVSFLPRGPGWEVKLDTMRVTAEALLDAASSDDSTGERFARVSDQWTRHRRLDGSHDSSERDG